MKKFWILSLLIVVGVTTASMLTRSTSGQKVKFQQSENGIPNRYIVVLDDKFVDEKSMAPAIGSEAEYLTYVYGGKVANVYANAFKGFVAEMSEDEARALSNDDRVAYVEQDAEVFPAAVQTGATWGIDRIDQRDLPLNSEYSYGTDASNVHAYIIDSGIRSTHVEFGGRATKDYDALTDGQNGNDCMGHGTHVAGTIGSATWGVAKSIRLHAVRVLPCSGSGTTSHLIMGIDWVTANHLSPAVANISVTASGPSNAIDSAIESMINSGVTTVVAAGNNNMDACNYSPARAANAITVGATYTADQKATYSNFGNCVDMWAPGSLITSVSYANDTDSRIMSGTSMASPHVTGVAALYLAVNPNANPATVAQNIFNTSTPNVVTGLDIASPNRLVYSWLGSAPPAPTPTPTPAPARVTIKKRANARTESTPNTNFPYDAVNFSASNFTLQPNNQIDDTNVTAFGSSNMITVTESQVYGWQLSSISCVETSGGTPNVVNTTVDLANRKAYIIPEAGEQIECTFTSDEIAPSASFGTVTGRILSPDGRGVRGAVLELFNADTRETFVATTNSFGYYKFDGMHVANFYVMTATPPKRYTISDNVQGFSLEGDFATVNFIASTGR